MRTNETLRFVATLLIEAFDDHPVCARALADRLREIGARPKTLSMSWDERTRIAVAEVLGDLLEDEACVL